MRAVVAKDFGSVDLLSVEDVRDPSPGEGQVLIEVAAASVNFADLLVIEKKYQSLPTPPFVPGKDVAGVVAAAGRGVSRVRPGERVMAHLDQGAYAEMAVAAEATTFVLPDKMPFVEAAAMGVVYQTAHFALIEHGRYTPGEVVLVNGATGGVGIASLQLAKSLGAKVVAGLTSPAKAAVARANGADYTIDLARADLANSLREQLREITNGRGADIILDLIGGEVFEASLRALAWRGRIVIIGFAGGRIPTIKANYLLVKNITASGLYWGSYCGHDIERVGRVQDELFALYREGRIRPQVMKEFPLEEFREALAMISGRKVEGRVVLTTGRGA